MTAPTQSDKPGTPALDSVSALTQPGPDVTAQLSQVVGRSLPHESAHLHVAGTAAYTDDLPEPAGTLHAALGLSPVPHGRLLHIDTAALMNEPGVVAAATTSSTEYARGPRKTRLSSQASQAGRMPTASSGISTTDSTTEMSSTGGAKKRSGLRAPSRRTSSPRHTPVAKNWRRSFVSVLRGQ